MNGEHTYDFITTDGCLTTNPELAAESYMIDSPGCNKRANNSTDCPKEIIKFTKLLDIFDQQLVVDSIKD